MRLILLLLLIFPPTALAQNKGARHTSERKEVSDVRRLQDAFREATEEYRESLRQLIALYEQEVERATGRAKKSQELYEANLVSARIVEEDKARLTEIEGKLNNAKARLKQADVEVQRILAESAELDRQLVSQPAKRERTPTGRIYYVRFIVIGEVTVYDYSGAIRGRVIKQGQRVRYDSRKK